jgi:hypothetical protein
LTPNQTRVPDPSDDRQRQYDVGQAWTKNRDKCNREQQSRKGKQDVDDAADRLVNRAAKVPRDRSDRNPDCGRRFSVLPSWFVFTFVRRDQPSAAVTNLNTN